MSFVIFLVLVVWLACIISKDKTNSSAKMRKYYKEYSPRKTKEKINFRDSKYPYRGLAIKDGYV